jgi:hypothetical protein
MNLTRIVGAFLERSLERIVPSTKALPGWDGARINHALKMEVWLDILV